VRFRLVGASGWAWKVAIPVACLAAAGQLAFTGTASARTIAPVKHPTASIHNLLDCNITLIKGLCTDPHGFYDGHASRFRDPISGAYVGHDEPSVKFISGAAGSANQMNYGMQLPVDPAKAPTASGSVTKYGELSVAPWFGLPICDPKSYPQNPCTNLSDSNSGSLTDPNAAGSAFMELQFYPPGFPPFADSTSCNSTKWCAALTIDSLECTFNFASCNNSCVEPINFSYLQSNGVPAGPPSPQKADNASFLPNANTLVMSSGDVLKVSISDVADSGSPDVGGLKASVTDVTTGKTGYIVASAANGFQNTSMADCTGTPFSFHAEYSSAKQQNQVPWAALEGGVLMEQEMGHGESCSSVKNTLGVSIPYSDGTFSDPKTYQNCVGGVEGSTSSGEGPCSATTGLCSHPTTQGSTGPKACSVKNPSSGALCEFADATCFPKGSRTVTLGSFGTVTESDPVAICYNGFFQNGDLDYDGLGYRADWPNGSSSFPTSIRYIGPFTGSSPTTYPQIQFETDTGGSQNLCNTTTGKNCTAPPISAKFYPYWTLTNKQGISGLTSTGNCVWNFGNTITNVTTNNFGKDTQYGKPDIARYGGTLTSTVMSNPEINATSCTKLSGF
jgi:hypothetical protein